MRCFHDLPILICADLHSTKAQTYGNRLSAVYLEQIPSLRSNLLGLSITSLEKAVQGYENSSEEHSAEGVWSLRASTSRGGSSPSGEEEEGEEQGMVGDAGARQPTGRGSSRLRRRRQVSTG
jgi:hypothetical protein